MTPDRSHLPHACGIYLMRDAGASILYVGKAKDLAKRVAQYFNPSKNDAKTAALVPLIRGIDYIPCASERESLLLERRLIRRHQPFFNSMWKDEKSYPYVKITLEEDFPRMLLTRRRRRDGGAYFGPYPKVTPVRGLLKYLWRQRFFPLRPCRWDFSRTKPLDPRKISACLYYHTKECPAPCAGRIRPEDYRRIASDAALFFRGRFAELQKRFAAEMRAASKRLDYERAAQLRDNLEAIAQMGERVRLRRLDAADATGPLEGSRAVTDLKEALGLALPPAHIECFDISHFQGRQTVASMVCFMGGEPHKEHYRRLRIAGTAGIDDCKSMGEAVRRRYQRLLKEGGPFPDLVLIDGGKGQLSSAQTALASLKLKLPLAALAKRLEELFVPGREGSIRLDKNRPSLRLIQHLRDEAHRVAVSYHRLLRGKRLFEAVGS